MRNSDVTSCRECKQYITQLEDKVIQSLQKGDKKVVNNPKLTKIDCMTPSIYLSQVSG